MKIQIYSHKTPEDALSSADLGVDFIGVAVGEMGRLQAEVSFSNCRKIFSAIPGNSFASRVALTVANDLDEILATIREVGPDIIHLSGNIDRMSVEKVAELRAAAPETKIMQAIPAKDDTSIELALAYQKVSDYLILDTDLDTFTGIGATGSCHDWSVSRKVVRTANVPTILAGGLGPKNVAEAISVVRPWCVDSFTHTNKENSRIKDPAKIHAFIRAARNWS
jgi:phosphoribosylanthranilate isomerase|tara:strand:+ start:326 stop:994 length:669 start_codon:yes stop_codon:yes gene_type:complete